MIGLDSNILIRYLVQDDPAQSRAATRHIEDNLTPERPGFISSITLAEVSWVLREAYGYDRAVIAHVAERLLATRQLVVEHSAAVQSALTDYREGSLDLADALIGHIGQQAGCEATMTFDRKAAKSAAFRLLES